MGAIAELVGEQLATDIHQEELNEVRGRSNKRWPKSKPTLVCRDVPTPSSNEPTSSEPLNRPPPQSPRDTHDG